MKKRFKLGLSFLLAALTLGGVTRLQTPTKLSAVSPEYLHGWDYDFNNGAAGSVSLLDTEIKIDVTNAGTLDWHAKLAKYGVALDAGDYQWKVVAKASRLVKANFIVNPDNVGVQWDREITTDYSEYIVNFHLAETKTVELLFQYGGNWEENKEGPYSIFIRELILSSAVESEVYDETFDENLGSYCRENHADVISTLVAVDGALKYEITAFGPDEPWQIRLRSGETGIPVLVGERFRVEAKVEASAYKQYELSISPSSYNNADRAGFFDKHFEAGMNEVSLEFVAEKQLDDLRLNFEMGKHDPLVDGKITLVFDDIKIIKFVPDEVISSVSVKFYKTVAEFAAELATIDSCIAGEFGYGAVPRLREDFVDHLLDPEVMETTYVTDYNYNFGGSGDKVEGAVTVSAKWTMLVAKYEASLPPGGITRSVNENQDNLLAAFIIGSIGVVCILSYTFIRRRNGFTN